MKDIFQEMERYTLGNERSILVSGKISSGKWKDIFQEMKDKYQ